MGGELIVLGILEQYHFPVWDEGPGKHFGVMAYA